MQVAQAEADRMQREHLEQLKSRELDEAARLRMDHAAAARLLEEAAMARTAAADETQRREKAELEAGKLRQHMEEEVRAMQH